MLMMFIKMKIILILVVSFCFLFSLSDTLTLLVCAFLVFRWVVFCAEKKIVSWMSYKWKWFLACLLLKLELLLQCFNFRSNPKLEYDPFYWYWKIPLLFLFIAMVIMYVFYTHWFLYNFRVHNDWFMCKI